MKQLRHGLTVGGSILVLAIRLQAQSSTSAAAAAWGDAVNGVRLRLALAPARPDEPAPTMIRLPQLEVQVRNDRDTTIRVATELVISGIEIDDVPYGVFQVGNFCRDIRD